MAINRLGTGSARPQTHTCARTAPAALSGLCAARRSDRSSSTSPTSADFHQLRAGLTDGPRRPPRGGLRYDSALAAPRASPARRPSSAGCAQRRRPRAAQPAALRAYPARAGRRARPRPPTRRARGASASASSRRPGRPSRPAPGVAVPVPRTDADGQPLGSVRFPEGRLPLGRLPRSALHRVTTSSGGGVYRNSRQLAPRSRPAVVAAGWVPRAVAVAGFDRALRRYEVSERYLLAADQPALLARAGSPRRRLAGVDPALTNRNTGSWVECVTSRAHRELSAQEQDARADRH